MVSIKGFRPRLPQGVVRKLQDNSGGGTHRAKPQYDRKRERQELRNLLKRDLDNQ